LGSIFRRIIDPEERHKFGQHYTNEDLVDLVNAFCIRHAADNVLDPACGSGSFLVRGYHRKAWLKHKTVDSVAAHQDRLTQIYGVDISLFAAHLSTLNLAARDIQDAENYPRIRRGNFFEVAANVVKKEPFCMLPQGSEGERTPGPILLPPLHAIVGNPPYVRQELIPRREEKGVKPMSAKEDLLEFCAQAWPGLKLNGRSDLHCYFWPAATRFLAENGWFGFLVSSSWLDVEYGFALQEWVLTNFRIHAILESNAEPWFEDARVKTCAVILQRCSNSAARNTQLVKFVRLDTPLKSILGERPDEDGRQKAAERFRDEILACTANAIGSGWRVVVRRQEGLWEDGLRAGRLFEMQKQRNSVQSAEVEVAEDEDDEGGEPEFDGSGNGTFQQIVSGGYGGGKWGKYLRAPNLYFRIMEHYGACFVPLGEITTVRFGVKSGCDGFFMPRDVSAEFLEKYSKLEWNSAPLINHCKRAEVESGEVKLVEAGDSTVHPVEAKFLKPEVHSLMKVNRAVISAKELDRLILYVALPIEALKGTHVQKYLHYGEHHSFASKRSKAVPVSRRSTCANRDPWYDLTYTKPGAFFWPMAQQYRHVVPANPEGLICNHNLFDVHPFELSEEQVAALQAIVNSTLIANFKTFYGRYAGTEGNLKTEVVDVNLLEVPDPRRVTKAVAARLQNAFAKLCQRDTGPMVEREFMECHSAERAKKLAEKPVGMPVELQMQDRRALDLAVFELLGVTDVKEREALCDELYLETATHFRQIRVVEIQKQEQRAGTAPHKFGTEELAADLWDSLTTAEEQPLAAWLAGQSAGGETHVIPEGNASIPEANDFLDATTVFFRQSASAKSGAKSLRLRSRAHAETIFLLSQLGFRGAIELPSLEAAAAELKHLLDDRLAVLTEKANHLAESRTGDLRAAADLAGLIRHWMIHGRPTAELPQG